MSWVRPLHRINVLLDGKSVAGQYDLGGGAVIHYGHISHGHRFLAPQDIDLVGRQNLAASYDEL